MTSEDPDSKSENGSILEANLMGSGLEIETRRDSSAKKKTSCCNKMKVFMASLSFVNFSKTFAGFLMKSSFTQLERRFGLSSSTTGFIDGTFEMGNLFVIAFVSYFGAKVHRPRVIALGCLIMSLGSFIIAMPHFFMGPYKYDTLAKTSSNSTFSISPCSASLVDSEVKGMPGPECRKEVASNAWIFIMIGNILRGIGETPIAPLGISYIDDFSRPEDTPFYIGFFQALGVSGPVISFILGSVFAKLYVDIGFVDLGTITITPSDSRWVGAWWMGFMLSGVLILISGIPFWFLPKSLGKKDNDLPRKNTMAKEKTQNDATQVQMSEIQLEESCTGKMKGFFSSLKSLLGNRVYIALLCSLLLKFNCMIGIITYLPKYIEQQYGLPASKANFIIGAVILPFASFSIFLGGVLMKKYKLSMIGTAKLAFATSFLGFLIGLPWFSVGCEKRTVAGLTVAYDGQPAFQHAVPLTSACNANCTCPADQWDPVCGSNGITYISACFAGCKTSTGSKRETVFHNCTCIEKRDSKMGNSSATLGECQKSDHCSRNLIYFIVINALSVFSLSLSITPSIVLIIRCIHKDLKSLAVGVYFLVMRCLGGLPVPVYFGAVIDKTCMKWAKKSCGQRGACMLYDMDQFRISFYSLLNGIDAPSHLLNIGIFLLIKKRFGGREATENKKEAPLNKEQQPSARELRDGLSDEERETYF